MSLEDLEKQFYDDEKNPEPEKEEVNSEPAGDLSFEQISKQLGIDEEKLADMIGYEVDGEFKNVKELKNGYLRNDKFTQKMQEASKLHGELKNYYDLIGRIEADPDFVAHIQSYDGQMTYSDGLSDDDLDELSEEDPQRYRKVMSDRRKVDKRKTEAGKKAELARQQTEQHWNFRRQQEMAQLQQKYPDILEKESDIEGYLRDMGLTNDQIRHRLMRADAVELSVLYEASTGKAKKSLAEDLKLSIKGKKSAPSAPVGGSGGAVQQQKSHERKGNEILSKAKGMKGQERDDAMAAGFTEKYFNLFD